MLGSDGVLLRATVEFQCVMSWVVLLKILCLTNTVQFQTYREYAHIYIRFESHLTRLSLCCLSYSAIFLVFLMSQRPYINVYMCMLYMSL